MDAASAKALRDYVSGGGTVLMTALSAKVDEHAQWFETPLPGRLSDVFGLKTNEFYEVESPLTFELDGASIASGARFYEVLEPSTASGLGAIYQYAGSFPGIHDQHVRQGERHLSGDRIEGVGDRAGPELHLQNGGHSTRSQDSRCECTRGLWIGGRFTSTPPRANSGFRSRAGIKG
jgi:hypothetical protein